MSSLLCALASGVTLEVFYEQEDGTGEEIPVAGQVQVGRGPESLSFSFAWATLLEVVTSAAHPVTSLSKVDVGFVDRGNG